MKKILLVTFISFISLAAMSQKVGVRIIKSPDAALSGWQIVDDAYNIVFSEDQFPGNDSVSFFLDPEKRYFLQISLIKIYKENSPLYTLWLNDEPVILVKTDIEPGDHSFPFFTGLRKAVTKITGGTTASITDFPWQVYYISGNFRCGGSIIGDNWILTAAHCTKDDAGAAIPVSQMSVKVGSTIATDGETYNVSQVIVNSGYDSQTLVNDIALLKLAVPINNANAKPIRIVNSDDVAFGATDPGVMAWVTGWGLTHVSPNIVPASLQKVQLPLISNAQASTVWGTIPSTDLMAGYLNGNKDACNGDSGGPLVVPVIDEYKLAGVVSWGSQSCNTYGAYTRVSQFETWIRTNTGIAKEYSPPAPVGDTVVCNGEVSSPYSISSVSGATLYEWQIVPAAAGVVSANNLNSTVFWNTGFSGSAILAARVTVNGVVSEWSRIKVRVVPKTVLLSRSADSAICAEQPIVLKVAADGYNLNYRWLKNGAVIQSGLSSQLIISSATSDNSGVYNCEVTGYCGTILSDNINLTVYPLTKITSISPDVQVPFGQDLSLTVNSLGHDLIYQWKIDSVVLDNTDTPNLFIPGINAQNTGIYTVIVKGTCGTETSGPVYVYVKKQNSTEDPQVFLWPSVTTDEFNVAVSNDALYNIYIYNERGEVIMEQTKCQYKTTLNISAEAKGTYIVNVFNNSFRKSLKVIRN